MAIWIWLYKPKIIYKLNIYYSWKGLTTSSLSLVFVHSSVLRTVTIRCAKAWNAIVRCVCGHRLTTLPLSGRRFLVIALRAITLVCGHTLISTETGLRLGFVLPQVWLMLLIRTVLAWVVWCLSLTAIRFTQVDGAMTTMVEFYTSLLRRRTVSLYMQSHWFVWWSFMVSMVLVLTLSSIPVHLPWLY